jgi:hypothetical protein
MGLEPEKHLHLADLYEKLGRNATAQTRRELAQKADWHRILARTSSSFERPADVPPQVHTELDPEALLFSPRRLWDAGRAWRSAVGTLSKSKKPAMER